MTEEKHYTVSEAVKILNASRATVTKWCRLGKEGKLPHAKKIITPAGEYWTIPESDIKNAGEVKMGRPKKEDQ